MDEEDPGDWRLLLGGDDIEQDDEADKVEAGADAPALLAAVKDRLAASGRSREYHDFLTIVSAASLDAGAALSIIKGYPDLVASFRRCFHAEDIEMPKAQVPEVDEANVDRRGTDARATQLVQLVFSGKAGHSDERAKMVEYVRNRAAQPNFPRRLIVLRGPPGVGKSKWAERALHKDIETIKESENFVARLTHICSTDDFFLQFVGDSDSSEMKYIFNPRRLGANHAANEARVRIAMEIGIEPLYLDNNCLKLWEMRSYVLLAERMGYVVTVESPSTINEGWNDLDFLVARNEQWKKTDKYVGSHQLSVMLNDFEPLPEGQDPLPLIRASTRLDEPVLGNQAAVLLQPTALLCKLEKLLIEGKNLLQYTPPDGKGWGVNGESNDEWHSFKENADGSCSYQDYARWETEEPETSWSFIELTMLDDLRKQALELPKADLPSATSHPALFTQAQKKKNKLKSKPPTQRSTEPVEPIGKQQSAIPVSRKERFKMRAQREKSDTTIPSQKAHQSKHTIVQPVQHEEEDEDDFTDLPTEQEEVSAAAFLAAVKARLTEWGKLDQYHEFVMAVSGTVDAKAAVRILRGHDDLLRVFRRKFAPSSDLLAIKAEIMQEETDVPRPPPTPPPRAGFRSSSVKEELGAKNRTLPSMQHAKPRTLVKSEMKSELRGDDAPRPPPMPPNAPRGTVTVGDDSDGEVQDEASITAAVKKGRSACIAQLAKTIFHRERATHDAARERLAMVHYATRVASKPRFPRELFILRGVPGVGKTDYAVQQLRDYVDVEIDEDLAARLTHVCSADDFFETFKQGESTYQFKAHKIESYLSRNETRTRLAMEAGVHPLFVDCPNLRIWEMRAYVLLADRLGYVTTLVEPKEICEKWNDMDYLMAANDTTDRQSSGKTVERGLVSALLTSFEPLENLEDPLPEIRSAKRPAGTRVVEVKETGKIAVPVVATKPGLAKTWQVKQEPNSQKRQLPAASADVRASKAARYLPTPAARAGYYGR